MDSPREGEMSERAQKTTCRNERAAVEENRKTSLINSLSGETPKRNQGQRGRVFAIQLVITCHVARKIT